jgi:hypothetical protein
MDVNETLTGFGSVLTAAAEARVARTRDVKEYFMMTRVMKLGGDGLTTDEAS